jgi:hypothetical protein
MSSTHSGFVVAYVFLTENERMASSLLIRDLETGKESQIIPTQVFGNSEDEVKEKMIEVLRQPFKKQNI